MATSEACEIGRDIAEHPKEVLQRLLALYRAVGASQRMLALRLDVHESVVSRWIARLGARDWFRTTAALARDEGWAVPDGRGKRGPDARVSRARRAGQRRRRAREAAAG